MEKPNPYDAALLYRRFCGTLVYKNILERDSYLQIIKKQYLDNTITSLLQKLFNKDSNWLFLKPINSISNSFKNIRLWKDLHYFHKSINESCQRNYFIHFFNIISGSIYSNLNSDSINCLFLSLEHKFSPIKSAILDTLFDKDIFSSVFKFLDEITKQQNSPLYFGIRKDEGFLNFLWDGVMLNGIPLKGFYRWQRNILSKEGIREKTGEYKITYEFRESLRGLKEGYKKTKLRYLKEAENEIVPKLYEIELKNIKNPTKLHVYNFYRLHITALCVGINRIPLIIIRPFNNLSMGIDFARGLGRLDSLRVALINNRRSISGIAFNIFFHCPRMTLNFTKFFVNMKRRITGKKPSGSKF